MLVCVTCTTVVFVMQGFGNMGQRGSMKGFELPATSSKTISPLQNGWGTIVDVSKKDDYVNTLTQVDLRAQEDTEELTPP